MTAASQNVVMFGVQNASYAWHAIQHRWPNISRPSEVARDMRETAAADICSSSKDYIYWYKAECTPDAALVTRAIGGAPGAMVFPKVESKFEFLKDMASATNHYVLEALRDFEWAPFTVISTDFVHSDVIDRIIELSNFSHERPTSGAAPAAETRASPNEGVVVCQPAESEPLVTYTPRPDSDAQEAQTVGMAGQVNTI